MTKEEMLTAINDASSAIRWILYQGGIHMTEDGHDKIVPILDIYFTTEELRKLHKDLVFLREVVNDSVEK